MSKYPIFLELAGRRVVVVGGGAVAARKAQALLDAGARLVVVAEHIDGALKTLCLTAAAEPIEAKYSKAYLTQAVLVIAATDNHKLNKQIYTDCQQLQILCNVVDSPELCDFFVPAVVSRGALQIAVGTEGTYPAYAGHIRKKLEKIFTAEHGRFLAELETVRKKIFAQFDEPQSRKALLGRLVDDESFELFKKAGPDAWRDRAAQIIADYKADAQ